MSILERYYTIDEISKLSGMSKPWVYKQAERDQWRFERIGTAKIFVKEDVELYLLDHDFGKAKQRGIRKLDNNFPSSETLTSGIQDRLSDVSSKIKTMMKDYDQLRKERDVIEQAGYIPASPSWRNGRFLYAIYPMKDGKRRSKYIGQEKEKIDLTLQGMAKWKRFKEITRDLMKIKREMDRIEKSISTMEETLADC